MAENNISVIAAQKIIDKNIVNIILFFPFVQYKNLSSNQFGAVT